MLRLLGVAAAMALGWATLELRSMTETSQTAAQPQPQPQPQPQSQSQPRSPEAQPQRQRMLPVRFDVEGGERRTGRALANAIESRGLDARGRVWLGKLSAVGGGRDTIVFVPDGLDVATPVEVVVYMEGHGSFADDAMGHRHASSIERLIAGGSNVVYVAPDAPSSAHGNRTAKTAYWQAGCAERPCAGGHAAPGDFTVFLEQALARAAVMAGVDAAALDVRLHLIGFSNGGKGVRGAIEQLDAAQFMIAGRPVRVGQVVFADGNYGGAWLADTWRVLAARGEQPRMTILVIDGSFTGTERSGGNRRRAAAFWRTNAPGAPMPAAGRPVATPRLRLVPLHAGHHAVGDAAVDFLELGRDVPPGS